MKSFARICTLFVLAMQCAWLACSPARAQGLEVTPTNVVFGPGQTAATLTVTNRGDQKVSFQIRGFSWLQDAQGKFPSDDAIAFAHKYGLTNIEIRNRMESKKEYYQCSEAEIKGDALRFQKEGLKVSFVNTGLLKFTWPGTEPARKRQGLPRPCRPFCHPPRLRP